MNDWIVAVFLGDSLTAGFQYGPGYLPLRYYPFTNLLESSLKIKFRDLDTDKDIAIVNEGMDGDSTRGMLERYTRSVEPENPNIVLLWGGINDLSSRIQPNAVFVNIVALVEKTRAINAIPIVLNVAPVAGTHFNETIMELNKLTESYCNEHEIIYVDIYSELLDIEGKLADQYSNDGIHLSDKGYQKILPTIFEAIMSCLIPLL